MGIDELLDTIAKDASCDLYTPSFVPSVKSPLDLPGDLLAFYQRCGGLELFEDEVFGFRIAPPEEFVAGNPVLLGKYYLKNRNAIDSDQSAGWYLIARGTKSADEFITIDLNPVKCGYCYDSFWEVHATRNSKVVARSFTELVERLYATRGTDLYWEHSHFDMGLAYD